MPSAVHSGLELTEAGLPRNEEVFAERQLCAPQLNPLRG